jgi:two-component system response regulator HydG
VNVTAPMKVLIVDDATNLRTTLADILAEEGHDVETACDASTAVARCGEEKFNVVLMDVRLPDFDGVEAFRRISRRQRGPRVIFMTAYSAEGLKEAALREGAIAFLTKPLDLDKLIRLVAKAQDAAVLVVDADPESSDAVCTALRHEGYHVTGVRTPTEALNLLGQIRFDFVFIDADLPAMNGLELYLQVRRAAPSIVAIMLAGRGKESVALAREAVRRTAYAVVPKPVDLGMLLALLRQAVGQRLSDALRKPDLVGGPEP